MMKKAEVKTICNRSGYWISQSYFQVRAKVVKCRLMLSITVLLLLSSAMGGCVSKIRVMLRDSITREPIVEARVYIGISRLVSSISSYEYSPGIIGQDGAVIISAEEKKNLHITIYPYYRGETDKNPILSWSMLLDHPAKYGNTEWVHLDAKYNILNRDPRMEIKLEKYIENDGQSESQGSR